MIDSNSELHPTTLHSRAALWIAHSCRNDASRFNKCYRYRNFFDDRQTDGDIADNASHDNIAPKPTTEGGSGARADTEDGRLQVIVCFATYLRIRLPQQVTQVRAEGAGGIHTVGDTRISPKRDILGQARAGIKTDLCLNFPA